MPGDAEKISAEWFRKAEDDEKSIRAILKENGAPSTACFLSQQLAEKYLKGLLVFFGRPFPKVHDLLQLETLLLGSEPEIKTLHEHLIVLNRYYIETRYPGDYQQFDLSEAQTAFDAALQVKQHILQKTNLPNV